MSRALSPRAEVFAVQYPGRQDRRDEATFTDLHALGGEIAGAVGVVDEVARSGAAEGAELVKSILSKQDRFAREAV